MYANSIKSCIILQLSSVINEPGVRGRVRFTLHNNANSVSRLLCSGMDNLNRFFVMLSWHS